MSNENQIPSSNSNLNVSDMVAIRQVIDTACTRGAFRANEMAEVGALFNKLDAFLDSITKPADSNDQPKEKTHD